MKIINKIKNIFKLKCPDCKKLANKEQNYKFNEYGRYDCECGIVVIDGYY